jgi:hypothetical protein
MGADRSGRDSPEDNRPEPIAAPASSGIAVLTLRCLRGGSHRPSGPLHHGRSALPRRPFDRARLPFCVLHEAHQAVVLSPRSVRPAGSSMNAERLRRARDDEHRRGKSVAKHRRAGGTAALRRRGSGRGTRIGVNVSSRISTAGTCRIGTSSSPSVAWRGRSGRALTGADTAAGNGAGFAGVEKAQ